MKETSAAVAIVTGGARRIGAVIARQLHQRGLNLLVHYHRSRESAEQLAAELDAARSGSVSLVQGELADRELPARIVSAARERWGRIDVLVNNASAFYPTPVDRADHEAFDDLMASNLRGPYFLSQAAAGLLSESRGSIVNLVDIHALVPLADHSIYVQAKAGLVMQTRALAKDLAPDIRVNAVAPGSILWPEDNPHPELQQQILDRVPLGRQGCPEDIAGAVAFLALDAPYITGQILAVDGGRLLNM